MTTPARRQSLRRDLDPSSVGGGVQNHDEGVKALMHSHGGFDLKVLTGDRTLVLLHVLVYIASGAPQPQHQTLQSGQLPV